MGEEDAEEHDEDADELAELEAAVVVVVVVDADDDEDELDAEDESERVKGEHADEEVEEEVDDSDDVDELSDDGSDADDESADEELTGELPIPLELIGVTRCCCRLAACMSGLIGLVEGELGWGQVVGVLLELQAPLVPLMMRHEESELSFCLLLADRLAPNGLACCP